MKKRRRRGRRNRAKRKIPVKGIIAGIVIIVVIAIAVLIAYSMQRAGIEESKISETDQQENVLVFPYELADGKLKATSLFQYSGLNPDCNNEEGEDIAALEIENQSDEFCGSVEIQAVMQDGTELSFKAESIPAGKKVWIFEENNQSITQVDNCKSIEGEAEFSKISLMEEQVSFSVDETAVTISNLTDTEITDLAVDCHCLFEDSYFGGLTYRYPVGTLPAGGTVTVEADDCYMGTAEVVCISKNN